MTQLKDNMTNIEKIRQEIERRLQRENEILWNAKKRGTYPNIILTLTSLRDFIDSLPEEDPLNDPKFCEGFDAGRAVQRIFDETEEKPSEDLEDAARYSEILTYPMPDDGDIEKVMKVQEARVFHEIGFKAGAEWQRIQMPMPEDTVIFMKGVEEGRRLEREEMEENKRKEAELPRYYGD